MDENFWSSGSFSSFRMRSGYRNVLLKSTEFPEDALLDSIEIESLTPGSIDINVSEVTPDFFQDH